MEAWNISSEELPVQGSAEERWKFFLRYAILAPSLRNSQPWKFFLHGNVLELYADRIRACPVVDPNDRELVMSCGCALFHLRCAMAHFGYANGIEILPDADDPDLLARVRMGFEEETTSEDSVLFYGITQRRTNRQPFLENPVPPPLLAALREAARAEYAWLRVVGDEQTRLNLAQLIAEGDRRQWADKRFRLELAAWLHPSRSASRDGIPGYAQGIEDLMSYAGPLVVRTFDMGEGQAAMDHQLATGSPALVVLGTNGDTARDWVHAGQALARILLRARVDDVWASFLNQAIELPDLRLKLAAATGVEGFPQLCLRLGYSDDIKPTPRREVEEVLM